MTQPMRDLRTRLAELADLHNVSQLLEWDHQTMMPPRGGPNRAESLATVRRIAHDLLVCEETGRLIEAAAAELDGSPSDSDEVRIVRVAARRHRKARRVPTELAAEMARSASIAHDAWVEARSRSDFAAFAPHLERNLDLVRRYVDCFDDFESPYDVLLDDYEPGMKTSEVATLFDELRSELVPLIARVRAGEEVDDSCLRGTFPVDVQRRLVADVVAMMGFDPESWRMDDAVHPFATNLGAGDTRITNRWDETCFASGLYGAMHECGHGLYEAGIAEELKRTPVGHGESLSLHESQSRMWENMVGRSRAFARLLAPKLAELFDAGGFEPEVLYRAVNRVEPSLIRVEADEATYGLHIVLRFELEQELVEGRLTVPELPAAWNAKVKDYLGIDVPDDAHGVLQDVHWSGMSFGYFPTYALGNLIAGQLWGRVNIDLPNLEQRIASGELGPLRDWLRVHVHRHGAKFSSRELLERVAGAPISVGPFVSYLKRKLSDVHRLDLDG